MYNVFLLLLFYFCFGFILNAQTFSFNLEGGAAAFARNDVRIPNEGGTDFDMRRLIGPEARPFFRLSGGVELGEKHEIRLLYAPLEVSGTAFLRQATFFENATFSDEKPVEATYRFSNYRATYRYTFLENQKWRIAAGATAFIRDARVQLVQDDLNEKNTDIGFVPLLHLYTAFKLSEDLSLILEGESLIGRQGRATDAAFMAAYELSEKWSLQLGYRVLEGGANVDEVYNFAWVNFAFTSITFSF